MKTTVQAGTVASVPHQAVAAYPLRQLLLYFLRLGTLGFGGPVALVGAMHRDLVEQRGWVAEEDYKEGLALAQLAPGPLAAQLAIYLGYLHYRVLGATLAGLAFVAPSFVMVLALGWLYVLYSGLSWMHAVFYGVGACVIGIIARSAYQLTRKTVGTDRLLWVIFLLTAALTVITRSEQVVVFLLAGIVACLWKAPPAALARLGRLVRFVGAPAAVAGVVPAAHAGTLWTMFTFFAKAGALVFGSGLAIVPVLYGGVVQEHHWLTEHQFVDAIAVAMITPGPVVITTGFIGFLVAGFAGASVAALATFLPCYLITVIAAPYFRRYGKRPGIAAFVKGVTAAAVGAITGAVIILGQRSLTDAVTGALALATAAILWRTKRVPEPLLVLGAAAIGLAAYPLVGR
jgi:chromate transporter